MSILDSFKKKKQKEEDFLNIGDEIDDRGDYGPAGFEPPTKESPNMGLPPLPGPMDPSLQPSSFEQRDMEIIKVKLDALKSEVDALKQRVRLLEEKSEAKQDERIATRYGTAPPKETGWHY